MSLSTPPPPSEGEPKDQTHCFYSAPTSITLKKGTLNESNGSTPMMQENNGFNGCTPMIKENKFLLRPVQPFDFGEGLPYAPIDWPNPGDKWVWKVGQRIRNDGYYVDRFLYLPIRLQKPRAKKNILQSKASVERYIRSEFPGANIDAFFASFSWNVPSTKHSWTVESTFLPPEVPPQVEREEVENEGIEKTPHPIPRKRNRKAYTFSAISRQRTRGSLKEAIQSPTKDASDIFTIDMDGVIHLCYLNGEETVLSESQDVKTPQESPIDVISEDFDNYLNSLEDILAPPHCEDQLSHLATITSHALENEIAESRRKLSSLLAMDFPSLVSSKGLHELTILASKLRKDPSLSVDQLIKLKLVEEIPLISEAFLETKGIIEQANGFFADLEGKKANVTSLKNEYNELKVRAGQLNTEIDSGSSAIEEINDQISQLQSRRDELSSTIETKKKEKIQLISTQKMVANSIPIVAREIQLAYSEKPDWDLKKITSAQREAEILDKFAPLKGFSL